MLSRSVPSVTTTAVDATTLSVAVTPPPAGQPWTSYSLAVCEWDGTTTSNCVTPAPTCAAATQAGNPNVNIPTTCTVDGLTPGQQYHVTAAAIKAGATTPPSAASVIALPWL